MSDLAKDLWEARERASVVAVETVTAPTTMAEAYAIQDEVVRLSGATVCGLKVGSTSVEAQRILGTAEPGSGPVLVPHFHESPARIAIAPAQMPAVEGEFAFRLGRDLPARGEAYHREEVEDAIDAVAGAVEVVGSRISGGLSGKGAMLVTADGGANIELIIGTWLSDWCALDLKTHRVEMSINGMPQGNGTGARALGDPINVMIWLANHRSERGLGLERGTCVSTGTCTGLDLVKPGDRVVAGFGALGSIEIDFE